MKCKNERRESMNKKCRKCGEVKQETDFWMRSVRENVRHAICKACMYKAQYQPKTKRGRLQDVFEYPVKLRAYNEAHPINLDSAKKMFQALTEHYSGRMNHASM